jgi:isochorismate synthase
VYTETFTPVELEARTTEEVIRGLFQTGMACGAAVAVWRFPNTDTWQVAVTLEPTVTPRKVELEQLPPGFVVSPFVNPVGDQTLFLPTDIYFDSSRGVLEEIPGPNELPRRDFIRQVLEVLRRPVSDGSRYHLGVSPPPAEDHQHAHYLQMVRAGLAAIRAGKFEKVVLARTKSVPLPERFDPVILLRTLAETYPAAFASLISIPRYGTWMGVSPELLLEVSRERVFRTVSLAGTQPADAGADPAHVAWTQKEIEEQALVSRFIINQFKKIRLREFTEFGPRTVVAGNLMHLRTDFTVDLNAVPFPELGSVMLHLLHPTSAVCGLPKRPALAFIRKQEHFDRAFYSGYLGPVNLRNETRIYVNLRCMQLFREQAVLYAGSGITHDSDPAREWEETGWKCQTLLRVLHDGFHAG